MAITDKEKGVWGLDQVYNKINQGSIWQYNGVLGLWQMGSGGAIAGQNTSPTPDHSSPIQIPGSTWDSAEGKFDVMDYNNYSAGAIKTDGTLWTWGSGGQGKQGRNDTSDSSSPRQVGSDTTWSKIAGGKNGFHAIKTDGTAWSWGDNEAGQLGLSDKTHRSSPTQIGSGTDWSRTAPYDYFGVMTKSDGTAWAMGNMSNDKIGKNNTSGASPTVSHVQVASDGWIDVQSTRYWTMGIGEDI